MKSNPQSLYLAFLFGVLATLALVWVLPSFFGY